MQRKVNTGFPIAKYSADILGPADLTYNSTAITASGTAGTNTLTLSAATGMQTGMYIRIDNALTGETFYITNLAGVTATLDANLSNTYAGATIFFGCVGVLPDLSGNSNHLVQATGNQQPLLINNFLNGRKALYFDGVNDRMDVAFNLNQPYTIFQYVNANIGGSQFMWDGYSKQALCSLENTFNSMEVNAGAVVRVGIAGTTVLKLLTVRFDGGNTFIQHNSLTNFGEIGANNPGGYTLFSRVPPLTSSVGNGYYMASEIYPYALSKRVINLIQQRILNQYAT